jgi:ribose transport system substrate-binding protein
MLKFVALSIFSRGVMGILVVSGLLLLLGACGNNPDEAAAAGNQPAKLRIAVIPKGTTHEFWKSVHSGVRKAELELGVEAIWMGPSQEDDREAQIKVVENFIVRGVDGIVISPLDDTALVPVLKDAAAEGIPVVILDSGVNWDGYQSFVATDNRQGGVLAARHLGGLLGGVGKVIMMRFNEGSASTAKRETGFLDTMKAEFAKIELVSVNQYGGVNTDSCYRMAENLLIQNEDLQGIFCSNEPTTFGMLRALQDAGRAGAVRFVGFDSTQKLLDAVRVKQIDGLVLQNPFKMGEFALRSMVEHLRGETVAKLIDTGVVIATAENVDDAAVKALWAVDFDKWLK